MKAGTGWGAGGGCGGPGGDPVADAARDALISGYGNDAIPSFDVRPADVPPDARVIDAAHDVGTDARPLTPEIPAADAYTDLPFGFPASLKVSTRGGTPALFTTNGATTGVLSRMVFGPDRTATSWSEFSTFDGYPFDHRELPDGRIGITRSSPHGLVIVNGEDGSISQDIDFSLLAFDLTDSDGTPYDPTFPAGIEFLSGQFCMALSNLDPFDYVTYHDGKFLCFPYADGIVDTASGRVATTSGKNPTGVGTHDGRFVVLSSNTYDPKSGGGAFVDLFDPLTLERETIPLGEVTAQSSATLAITDDGFAVIGLYSPRHLVTVDLETSAIDREWDLLDAEGNSLIINFISNVALYGGIAILSDNGPIDGTLGRNLFVNLDPSGWIGIPFVEFSGSAGPATVYEEMLYQSITRGDYTGGIVTVPLEGL